MKKILLVFLGFNLSAFAVNEFYSLSRSIRSMGMGGAFYTLSNDEYALFYNPAGLSLYQGTTEVMFRINAQMAPRTISGIKTLTDLLKDSKQIGPVVDALTQYQGDPLYANAGLLPYLVRKNFAVGLLLADTKVDMAVLGKELDTSVDFTAISDTGLIIGYGQEIPGVSGLHVGLNLKGLVRAGGRKAYSVLDIALNQNVKLSPKDLGGAGIGVDADLGAIYELNGLPWGVANRASLTFNNLAASNFGIKKEGTAPGLVRMMSVGYHTVLEGWKFVENFHVLVDFAEFSLGGETNPHYGARTGTFWKHLNFGVEMPMKRFALRTGFHQGYISAGFGINLSFMRLDFATYGEELAFTGPGRLGSRRFALSLAFGSGSAPVPVASATGETVPTAENPKPNEIPAEVGAPKAEPKLDPNLKIEDKPKGSNP